MQVDRIREFSRLSRATARSLRSNCDKNVVSKEIAVLSCGILERDGKEISRPEGARRCYLSGPEDFLALRDRGSFLRVSLRGAASSFDRRDHDARISLADNSLSSGETNPQDIFVELMLTWRSIYSIAIGRTCSFIAGERPQSILPARNVCIRSSGRILFS